MVQCDDCPSLALEPRPQIVIAGDLTRQNLDRDRPLEARIACFVDLTHPARADLGGQFIRAEAGPGTQ
jgi:hypothetical protein